MNTLTRIIDCVYTHVSHVIRNQGHGPYNSLCHTDYRKCFSGLSLMRNGREVHMFDLARKVGKIWRCSC